MGCSTSGSPTCLANFCGSLLLNGLVAGLSLLFAAMTYRQIVRPLRRTRRSSRSKVRETKDYSLRTSSGRDETKSASLRPPSMPCWRSLPQRESAKSADQARNAAMQAELARVARLTTMGEMAASIAHEINQPLAAVVNNANAGLRWLNREPPNTEEVRSALMRIVNDGERGGGIIESIRAMLKKGVRERTELNLNELISDVTRLTQGQFQRHGVVNSIRAG